MTAEQLEYLIQRLRTDRVRVKGNWQYRSFFAAPGPGAAAQILNVDENRKWVWFSAQTQTLVFAPTDVINGNNGILVPANNAMPIPLSYDDIGWPLTRAWSAFNVGGAPGTAMALVMSGP